MQENQSSEFPTRSDTNRPVQSQKQVRNFGFKKKGNFNIHVAKTKALISFAVTAKLISDCEADLHWQKSGFLMTRLI